MILYTPLSEYDIIGFGEEHADRMCVSYFGKMVYVTSLEDGAYEIVELLSTDPMDFTDENYYPGKKINISAPE